MTDVEIGSTVRESAVDIDGYKQQSPITKSIVLAESGNEIIFRYYMPDYDDPA